MSCDVNALLLAGRDFQRCSEREQMAIIAQLLCDISQSGPVWAMIRPDGTAYGPSGAIDTTGTTTCGIQEVINSFPSGDLTSRFAGGGVILFGKGVYSCSGQITIPNQGAYNLRMEGVGKVATILKYTGTGSSFINTAVDTVSGPPGNASLQFGMRSMGVTHLHDTILCTLVRLGSVNEADFDDALWCPDGVLAGGGNCLNYTNDAIGHAVGTEGLRTIGDNMVRIRNSAAWCCARALTLLSAHSRIDNTIIAGVSEANSLYSFSESGGAYFPKAYGIMAEGDCILNGVHMGSTLYADAGVIQANNTVWEGEERKCMVSTVNGGSIQEFNPNYIMEGNYTPSDYDIDAAGNITASTSGNIVHFISPLTNSGAELSAYEVIRSGNKTWIYPTCALLGSDQTTTGQSLATVSGLSVALDSGSTYEFEAALSVTSSADTTGCKYGVTYFYGVLNTVGGATVEAQIIASLSSSSTASERISALSTATANAYLTTSSQSGQVLIKGTIIPSQSGTLAIQHLKVTSGTSTVRANSFLKVRRIA